MIVPLVKATFNNNDTLQAGDPMKCKKCRKQLPEESKYCNHCGTPQKKETLYRRPDGLYEKMLILDGARVTFRAKSANEVYHKIAAYKGKKESGPTFAEVADAWETNHVETLAYNTQKSYTAPLRRAVEEFGPTFIRQIKSNDVNSFIGRFARQGYSQQTVKNQLLVINQIFRYAAIDGYLETNPAQYITVPKNLPKNGRTVPEEAYLQLIRQNADSQFGFLALFILYTGLRIGEALALQHKDIDREKNLIHVTKSVYYNGNRPIIKSTKTAAGTRDIILLNLLAEKLPNGPDEDYLFGGKTMFAYSHYRHGWNAYCKSIGATREHIITDKNNHSHAKIVPLITPHQLRHGFATILFEAGIDEKDAQELMGHSSITVTRDIYTHIRKSRKDKTAQQLNDYADLSR